MFLTKEQALIILEKAKTHPKEVTFEQVQAALNFLSTLQVNHLS